MTYNFLLNKITVYIYVGNGLTPIGSSDNLAAIDLISMWEEKLCIKNS